MAWSLSSSSPVRCEARDHGGGAGRLLRRLHVHPQLKNDQEKSWADSEEAGELHDACSSRGLCFLSDVTDANPRHQPTRMQTLNPKP